jgi:hypothetical protein
MRTMRNRRRIIWILLKMRWVYIFLFKVTHNQEPYQEDTPKQIPYEVLFSYLI